MATGSMVLGGIVVGPAVLVAGFFASSKAEKVKTEVTKKIAEMDVAEVQIEQQLSMPKSNSKSNSTFPQLCGNYLLRAETDQTVVDMMPL